MKKLYFFRLGEQKGTLIAFLVGLTVFSCIMAWSYEAFSDDSGFLTQMFSQFEDLMQAFVGVGFSLDEMAASYFGMTWRHPLVLFLIMGFGISRSVGITREIQSGTGDLLFTLPLKRYLVIFTDFMATVTGLFLINLLLVIAVIVWSLVFGIEDIPGFYGFLWAFLISFYLHVMFAALALAIACLSKTTSQASAWTISIIAIFYVTDFLASLQPQLEFLQPFTLFYQYQVPEALAGNALWTGSLIYIGLTLTFLGTSFFLIQRRDL